jgi:hypothetical protein
MPDKVRLQNVHTETLPGSDKFADDRADHRKDDCGILIRSFERARSVAVHAAACSCRLSSLNNSAASGQHRTLRKASHL